MRPPLEPRKTVRLQTQAGMSLTLNGIAQGYITDRVTAFLRQSGYQNVLVHLGETYGAGHKSSGQPWRALIDGTEERIDLTDYALATSGSPAGSSITHLFDPGTARTASLYNTVSVTAPTAMLADGLSTAFHFLDTNQIQRVLSTYQRVSAVLVDRSGHILKQLGVND